MKITFVLNLQDLLRWFVGLIFVWAALSKLANLQDFYANMLAYQLPLPALLQKLAAVALPWLELLCGLLVLARLWYRPALLWILILCGLFVLATGQAWLRGLNISCGCLNLQLLGLDTGKSAAAGFLETPMFAFFRAILLAAITFGLWRLASRKDCPVAPLTQN